MPKILLVDDDPTMLSLLKTLLELEGFSTLTYSGREPVSLAELMSTEHPDMMLLDVHLKTANGFDILKSIRQDPKLVDLKVIMTSGMDLRNQCLANGANEFLMKPYNPSNLLELIQTQLNH